MEIDPKSVRQGRVREGRRKSRLSDHHSLGHLVAQLSGTCEQVHRNLLSLSVLSHEIAFVYVLPSTLVTWFDYVSATAEKSPSISHIARDCASE
jgi:hypothetical protein